MLLQSPAQLKAESLDANAQRRLQKLWSVVDVGEVTLATVNPIQTEQLQDKKNELIQLFAKVDSVAASFKPTESLLQGQARLGIYLRSDVTAEAWLSELDAAIAKAAKKGEQRPGRLLGSLKRQVNQTQFGEMIMLEGPVDLTQL